MAERSAAAEMFAELALGTALVRHIRFPGTDREVVLKPLTRAQMQEATAAALARFKELGIELTMLVLEDYNAEFNLQCFARALRDPANAPAYEKPFFGSADEARSLLSEDQCAELLREYSELMTRANPDLADIDEATLLQIDEYAKKKAVASLMAIGSRKLASFIITSVCPPETSPTGRSGST